MQSEPNGDAMAGESPGNLEQQLAALFGTQMKKLAAADPEAAARAMHRLAAPAGTNDLAEWSSNQDLAARYTVPLKTVIDWRNRGVGPRGVRLGRHVRYHRDAVLEWERQRIAAAS